MRNLDRIGAAEAGRQKMRGNKDEVAKTFSFEKA